MIRRYLKFPLLFFVGVTLASSCTHSETTSKEEVEITTMDSTSRVLEETREKLEEQTKKVEASLEKLENEVQTAD